MSEVVKIEGGIEILKFEPRIWDIPPEYLCDAHLYAQHEACHEVMNAVVRGYDNDESYIRWEGHERALARRHDATVHELKARGIYTQTPLDTDLGALEMPHNTKSLDWQRGFLSAQECGCDIDGIKSYISKVKGDADGYDDAS
jgi:hypothetical protein